MKQLIGICSSLSWYVSGRENSFNLHKTIYVSAHNLFYVFVYGIIYISIRRVSLKWFWILSTILLFFLQKFFHKLNLKVDINYAKALNYDKFKKSKNV